MNKSGKFLDVLK
jgi:hypothetical protein